MASINNDVFDTFLIQLQGGNNSGEEAVIEVVCACVCEAVSVRAREWLWSKTISLVSTHESPSL